MDIHTTNLGPGGTQQPTETFVTNTPFQTFVGQIKENNTYKKVLIKKDDCIKNYMKQILKSVKLKRYNKFYSYVINDANIRNKIKKNN